LHFCSFCKPTFSIHACCLGYKMHEVFLCLSSTNVLEVYKWTCLIPCFRTIQFCFPHFHVST
jgi:hypothetical protein